MASSVALTISTILSLCSRNSLTLTYRQSPPLCATSPRRDTKSLTSDLGCGQFWSRSIKPMVFFKSSSIGPYFGVFRAEVSITTSSKYFAFQPSPTRSSGESSFLLSRTSFAILVYIDWGSSLGLLARLIRHFDASTATSSIYSSQEAQSMMTPARVKWPSARRPRPVGFNCLWLSRRRSTSGSSFDTNNFRASDGTPNPLKLPPLAFRHAGGLLCYLLPG
jgi:hypothetical protein